MPPKYTPTHPRTSVMRECPICRAPFVATQSQLSKGNGKYCSRACGGVGRRTQVPCICLSCGTPFQQFPSEIAKGGGKYCSAECYARSTQRPKPPRSGGMRACRLCGTTYYRPRCVLKKGGGIFCSRTCYYEAKRLNLTSPRSCREYRAWRAAVLARDANICQECGKGGGKLHAHHIKKWEHYIHLRFTVENGVTLCEGCHTEVHKYDLARRMARSGV